MNKIFSEAKAYAVRSAKKLTHVTAGRGKTAIPKAPKDQENLGIRWDFDGEVTRNGIVYNKFQVQPNRGKVPSSIREWLRRNGGTHAVMGTMYVKKEGTEEDVQSGFAEFEKGFKE